MGLLDRYVLRSFLLHWLVLGASLLLFFTAMDAIGQGDEIAESASLYGSVGGEVVDYYLLNLPFLLVQFAPYITLLAGLGTVIQLSRASEWAPVVAGGRSSLRALLPLFGASLAAAAAMVILHESVLPRLAAPREAVGQRVFKQRPWKMTDLWARGPRDERLRAGEFRPGPPGKGAPEIDDLEVFDKTPRGLDRVVKAGHAAWDGHGWVLAGGTEVLGGEQEQPLDRLQSAGLGPQDLLRSYFSHRMPLTLSSRDLKVLLERDPGHRQAATLLWAWRAAPLAHWILLLLGLAFVLRFDRPAGLEGVARGLLLCMLFFVGDFLLRDLGGRGVLSPFWGGAGATVLFGCLGIWAVDRLPT